ncbi:MAG TPA: helix-turn-helix transcriptional regulator [Clostridia bacterium]|nr:helix-turn-helix transcriptional regulator [Clostridia bacterium]
MSTVAEQLRQAREAQSMTIEQVAEITKLRSDHVRALEEGNYEVFSAPVYINGFVRTYATLLKLDVKQVMAALEVELGRTSRFSEPPPLSDQPKGIVDFITLQLSKLDFRVGLKVVGVLLVVAVAVLIFLLWRHYRTSDPLKDLQPGMYQNTQHQSGATLPVPPASKR